MDRIILHIADLEKILKWRDEHKAEVRSAPVPMKAVEIRIIENGFVIKGVRDGDELLLRLSQNGNQLGNVTFVRRPDGYWNKIKDRMKVSPENTQSVLTTYASLMALMVYGSVSVDECEITMSEKADIPRTSHKPHKRRSSGTTYIIRKTQKPHHEAPSSHHVSPRGYFSVRGHYRHYKTGKVVWINEYMKGDKDEKKKKTYKLGQMNSKE